MDIITHYDALDGVYKEIAKHGPVHIWYFGSDAEVCIELKEKFHDEFRIDEITSLMNEVADSISDDLINMDHFYLNSQVDRDAWDASLISDLSPYVGDLQLNISRFLLLKRFMETYKNNLFIIDDVSLGYALYETARKNDIMLCWFGQHKKRSMLFRIIKARLSALRTAFYQKWLISKLRKFHSIPWNELKKCDVVLVDWSEPDTFLQKGKTEKFRNLRNIPEILRASGLKIGFIALPISWIFPYHLIAENVATAEDPVVLIDECRSMCSVLWGAWKTWGLRKSLKKPLNISGYDISPIIAHESLQDMIKPQASLAFSFRDVGRVLASHGISPKTIMLPYENQGWERVLKSSMRKYLPKTRCVSYQFVPISKRLIGFYPSQREIDEGRISDDLLCIGSQYASWFAERGYPRERLHVAGSLQFSSLLGKQFLRSKVESIPHSKTVLCSTSVKYSESLDLVLKTIDAAQQVGFMKIIVNYHPTVPDEFKNNIQNLVEKKFGEKEVSIEFSNKRITDLLFQSDIVTYNSSGSSFDALLMGIPVVYVSVDGSPSYNRIPDGLASFANNHDQLLRIFLNLQQGAGAKIKKDSIQNCIGQVQSEVFVESVNGA